VLLFTELPRSRVLGNWAPGVVLFSELKGHKERVEV
jgi:hypothetical protein